jgi:hypothetical protein
MLRNAQMQKYYPPGCHEKHNKLAYKYQKFPEPMLSAKEIVKIMASTCL